MARYEILYRLHPPALFGLPDGDKILRPGSPEAPARFETPTLDTWTGNVITQGTLSHYRENPLHINLTIGAASVTVQDDVLWIRLDATTDDGARTASEILAQRFCLLLTAERGDYVWPTPLQGVALPDRRPLFPAVGGMSVTIGVYDLDTLTTQVHKVGGAIPLVDAALEKACVYYHHASFLDTQRGVLSVPPSLHWKLLVAEAILHYHKAVSAIVGDPTADKDYGFRYRRLGIPDELWTKVGKLRHLRNDYDVAHYSPGMQKLEDVQSHLSFSQHTSQAVISAYVSYLRSKPQLSAPT